MPRWTNTRRTSKFVRSASRVGLGDFTKFRPGKLSGGLARRLNIACGIAHKPELIFFDEPTVAVDPQSRNAILGGICRLRDEGATVIFSTHNMESVEALCDNFTLINRSRNILSGNVAEIRREMGKNHYRLSFQGDADKLIQTLGPSIRNYNMSAPEQTESGIIYNSEFTLNPDVTMHDFIQAANDTVEIVTFDRALPSMNEIFIRTVENYNNPAPFANAGNQ